MDDLATCKNELFKALGDQSSNYLSLLRLWFKATLSKLEFDTEARKILSKETITFHNRFLVSLFTHCNQLANKNPLLDSQPSAKRFKSNCEEISSNEHSQSSFTSVGNLFTPDDSDFKFKNSISKKTKIKTPRPVTISKFTRVFDEARLLTIESPDLPSARQYKLLTNFRNGSKLKFCTSERMLPDHFMSNLRLFVNVWEFGIDGISDDAILITNLAIRDFIKNVITSTILFKSHHKSTLRPSFITSNTYPNSNCFLNNAQSLIDYPNDNCPITLNENGDHVPEVIDNRTLAKHKLLLGLACGPQQSNRIESNRSRIRLTHLYHALKTYRSTIPIHSIYSVNMERMQMKLHEEDRHDASSETLTVL